MYHAKGLSTRLASDPQMQIPERPRFSEDYLLVPMGEAGLLIIGAEKPELFRGKAAEKLLPRLLPLLNGTRTCEELHAFFPQLKLQIIRDTISLLFFRGLLEEGETDEDHAAFSDAERTRYSEQLQFFGRYTDVSRASHNRYGTQQRLKEARVLIVAASSESADIAAGLAENGVGRLSILPAPNYEPMAYDQLQSRNPFCEIAVFNPQLPLSEALDDHTFVLAIGQQDDREQWGFLDQLCKERGISWLRAVIGGRAVEVGPLFTGGEGACYQCALTYFETIEEADQIARPLETAIGIHYIHTIVLMHLCRLFIPKLSNQVHRLELATGTKSTQQILRLPRCGVCGMGSNTEQLLHLPDDLALLYHLDTNHRWEGASLKGHQLHYSEHVSDLTAGAYKVYRGLPKVALPPLETLPPLTLSVGQALTGERAAPPERVVCDHVSQICGWSARWRKMNTIPFRFTPSGGSLCSADLYVLAWDVEGLEPGIYHYDGSRHQLEVLQPGSPRDALRPLLGPAALVDRSAFAIVQSSHLYRLSSKYGPRAYRYTHLDAGVMIHSLRLVGQAVGLPVWNVGQFVDDAIGELLGIPPLQEFPSQIVLVGYPQSSGEHA
jgi:SagB-type dehydrogenase family enzyme